MATPPATVYDVNTLAAIPPEKVSEAIANGTARWNKGDRVSFVDPTGKRYDVDGNEAWDAINRGWHPESPQEQFVADAKARPESLGTALGSAAIGAANTLSLGTAAPFVALIPGAKEAVAQYPAAEAAGGLGALAVPFLGEAGALGKGEALLSKAARGIAAPTRWLSRLATGTGERAAERLIGAKGGSAAHRAARGVVKFGIAGGIEGSVFGASQEFSRQAMGDEDYSGEKILSAGVVGGILGIGTGAALSGLGSAARGVVGSTERAVAGRGSAKVEEAMLAARKITLTEDLAAGKISTDEFNKLAKEAEYLHKTTRLAGTPEHLAAKSLGLTDYQIGSIGSENVKKAMRYYLDNGAEPSWFKALKEDVTTRATKVNVAASDVGKMIGAVPKAADEAAVSQPLKVIRGDDPNWGTYVEAGAVPEARALWSKAQFKKVSDLLKRADQIEAGAVTAEVPTWPKFLKGKMGPAMREHGSHEAAVRALAAEYQALKVGGGVSTAGGAARVLSLRNSANKLLNNMRSMSVEVTDVDIAKVGALRELLRVVGEYADKAGVSSSAARASRRLRAEFRDMIAKTRSFKELHEVDSSIARMRDGLDPRKDFELANALNQFRTAYKANLYKSMGKLVPDEVAKLPELDKIYAGLAQTGRKAGEAAERGRGTPETLTSSEAGRLALGAAFGLPGPGVAWTAVTAGMRQWKNNTSILSARAAAADAAAKQAAAKGAGVSTAVMTSSQRGATAIKTYLPVKSADVLRNYDERRERAAEIRTNPQAVSARVAVHTVPITELDPVRGRRAVQTITQDLQWLDANSPKASYLADMLNDRRYSKILQRIDKGAGKAAGHGRHKRAVAAPGVPISAAASFNRAAEQLADPFKGVSELEKGHLVPELIPVLHDRRPGLLKAVAQAYDNAEASMAAKGQEMGYVAKIQASLITGKSYDVSMTPEYIAMVQGIWAERNAAKDQQDAQAAPGAPAPGRKPTQWSSETLRKRTGLLKTSAQEGLEEKV